MKIVHYIDNITVKKTFSLNFFFEIVLSSNNNYHLVMVLLSPNIHGV
jgi:hypothetical protein